MRTKITIGILAVMALVGIVFASSGNFSTTYARVDNEEMATVTTVAPSPSTVNPTVTEATTTDTTTTQTSGLSMATVATHASASDCWVVVGGKTYNLTSFITVHPGGAKAITRECGADATNVFNKERAHVQQGALAQLAMYFVGNVKG